MGLLRAAASLSLALLLGVGLFLFAARVEAGGGGAPAEASEPVAEVIKRPFTPTPAAALPALADKVGRIKVLPIHGAVDLGMAAFVERSLADTQDATIVILDVNTFGGRIDAAVKIRDALLGAQVTTLAFVNRRAISAGALISLAADHIVFTSGATMGAATPVEISAGKMNAVGEKMTSYMRSEMRATAEAKGRNGDIAEAMVDASIFVDGISEAGKLLTLTTALALETGMAAAELDSLDALCTQLGKPGAQREVFKNNWAEKVVRVLTEPTLSGLLMSVGMAALMIDIYTAGFGLTGLFGLMSLSLFFGGHMVVGLAGWEELLLFLIGIGAIAVEVFVLPGFGVAGAIGIVALLASATMTMLHLPLLASWDAGMLTPVLTVILFSLLGTIGLVALVFWLLGSRTKSPGGWLVLTKTLETSHAGASRSTEAEEPEVAGGVVGREGVALTDLRLAGKAKIEGRTYDVVSEMDYVERGASVKVIQIEGPRIVVVEIPPNKEPQE